MTLNCGQPPLGIRNLGQARVGVLPEVEESFMIYMNFEIYFLRPILLKRSVKRGSERTGSNLGSLISNK
jgi:hypothetical protein